MVRRWNCRHCDFSTWGPGADAIAGRIKSHVVKHHLGCVTNEEFQLTWECPYCDENRVTHDEDDGLREFKDHLYDHVEPLIESGSHVADSVDGTGSVLVLAPLESPGANNARTHFISACDIAIFVTRNPAARVRLLDDRLDELPAWTILITTVEEPLAGVTDVDLSNFPLEIVRLDKGLGLAGLGETLSRVVDEQESASGKITVDFDILTDIATTFGLQEVFKFMHLMTARLEEANALSHYYVDPNGESESSINMLKQVFDMTIEADEVGFSQPD